MLPRGRITFLLLLFAAWAVLLCFDPASSAFAFRSIEIGKRVPEMGLKDVDGNAFALSQTKARKIVLVFWGTDSELKEKRSLALLNSLEHLYVRFKGEGLEMVSVISEADAKDKVLAYRKKYSWTHHILIDEHREVYGSYGVYILPTAGILDGESKLVEAIPYTHQMEAFVEGAVLVALGKKTKEEWEKERNPEQKVVPDNVRKAQLHYNLGKGLSDKKQTEKAREEFARALQLDPDYADACVAMAQTYLSEKKAKEALPLIEKALTLNPGLVQAGTALALAWDQLGELDKAVAQLKSLLEARHDTPEIHFHLGRLYEKKGETEQALSEYRKALRTIFRTDW